MKKIIFLTILSVSIFFACKKNDNGGTPVITSVRAIDSTERDSLFTTAVVGNLIVIQGNNLGGVQSIFFNDTPAVVNPVYATSTHIIITIPGSAPTKATASVPNQIKVVTNHGTAVFTFTLTLNGPFISGISFNNTGALVLISGGNFQGIQKITFPGGDTAVGYAVNTTYNIIAAVIPPSKNLTDSLRIFCTYGHASFPFPPPMTVSAVSNENGPAGTTIILKGTNFIGISKVMFPGNIAAPSFHADSVNQLSVVVPPGVTAPDSLRVMGVLGTATYRQLYDTWLLHPTPGYLNTFDNPYASDNTGASTDWTGTHFDANATDTVYPGGTAGSAAILNGSPIGANSGAGSQGNPGFIQNDAHPWVASPTTALTTDYSLKFEAYVKKKWTAGSIWITTGGWYGWGNYAAKWAPWITDPSGAYQTSGWVTITIPLTSFLPNNNFYNTAYTTTGTPTTHLSDFSSTATCFMLMNDDGTAVPAGAINIAIDNVRVVKGK